MDSMLNDDSKQARVALRGNVNGMSFEVERVVKVRAGTPLLTSAHRGLSRPHSAVSMLIWAPKHAVW